MNLFNEKTKIRGGLLVHHLKQFTPSAVLDLSQYINCPKCIDVQMQRSVCGTDIEIDTMRDSSGYTFLPIYDTKEQLIESLKRLGFEYTTEFQQELF